MRQAVAWRSFTLSQGDNDVNCGGTVDCYGATASSGGGHHGGGGSSSSNGALSTSSASYAPAYTSHAGWNFATGMGSINAYNLVMNW